MPTSPATDKPAADPGMNRPTRSRDRNGGFALVELMLALAIISLLAALALPSARLRGGPGMMRFEAQRVAAFLRSDRNAALRSGRAVSTRFDVSGRRLESGVAGAVLDLSPAFSVAAQPRMLSGFRFSADGRSSGGRLLLGPRGKGFAIDVNPETAAVQVGEF